VLSLALSCHPGPTVAMTATLGAAAALTGRGPRQCLLVAATVATGQVTVGWVNDLVDVGRDRRAGRLDKPVARGWVSPATVLTATGCAALLVVPLSLANGTASGAAHLAAVASAWSYNLLFKATPLSFVPYAVSFGLLPAFLSYGGLGRGRHGGAPTLTMTALAALLGVGIHVLNTLPDLAEDEANGVRHLPLRVAEQIGVRRLRRASVAGTATVALAMGLAGVRTGVRR
jgi:4-hydroxybenzoate polyprenyltransferase